MGTVTGPASSTDNAITRWDGTSGTVVKDSSVLIDDSGNMTGVASLSSDGGDFTSDGSGNVSLVSLTGNPTATTQSQGDNSTKIATTAYVDLGLASLSLGNLSDCKSSGVNLALGANASYSGSGDNGNLSVGINAGRNATNGPENTLVGIEAGSGITTGGQNTVLGYSAGGSLASGQSNVLIGAYAGDACTGDYNIVIGTESGLFLNGGSNNILIQGDVPSGSTSNYLNIGNVITGDMTSGPALMDGFTATTQSSADNSTKIATTAYVDAAVSGAGTVVYKVISGNLPSSMTGTHTSASMSVSAGQAADSTNSVYITGAGYTWAVSNGNAINGYQGGTTLPNSSTIHMYLCSGASGTGVFASTSLSPTLPTGYDEYFRRIFSFNTNSSGAPIPYSALEVEGGSILCYLATQTLDISTSTLGSSARTLYALNVPSGIKVSPLIRWVLYTNPGIIFTSPDESDVAPSDYGGNTVPLYDSSALTVYGTGERFLTTNTSGQIGIRAHSGTNNTIYVTTRGFKDFRRS